MDKIIVSRTGAPLLAFPDLSLEYRQRVLLRGPSGSGKTTLLCVMMGLLKPSAGSVRIAGQDLYKMPLRDRDPLRGRTFGYVFQTLHLLPSLTITQNIALAAEMAQLPIDEQRLKYLINVLGLTDKAHRFPGALSQGEQQRAAIARAVLNKPPVIIADEPTSALDDDNTHIVMELLRAQAQETGATLVIATHDSRISAGFDSVIHLGHSAGRGV
jgi:putative ABC transport system ATP-binding protein